ARALNNLWSGGWKRAQPLFRALIRAMLVPHGREDAEFGESRLPADQVENTLIFVRLQPMRGHQLVSDGDRVRVAHYASTFQSNNSRFPACQATHACEPVDQRRISCSIRLPTGPWVRGP